MRSNVFRLEDYEVMTIFRLTREVMQTSVGMGVVLVLVLFWGTGTFERTAAKPIVRAMAAPVKVETVQAAPTLPRVAGGQVGLQLYSLRHEFERDGVTKTLDRIQAMGFRYIEGGGTYGLTPQTYKAELDRRGLQMVSYMTSYDNLRFRLSDHIASAKFYGAQYLGTAWIPHEAPFSEAKAREAALVFNQAGAACKAAGIKFFYHIHGFEFQPTAQGTLFDLLLKECKPALVNFELDVFWATHGGQDAAQMLRQHPSRFLLTHLKDLRKDVKGDLTGKAPDDTSVVLGTGKVNWPDVLRAAKRAGIKWHFIEAEELEAAENIPQSLAYLKMLKF
ncbi:MAG: sugar phosphate isomerase/epimerase [Acidobacteria bacterium]|nr:sugar phosphate isomerase/epimerase [Acidobacteriota bacterium]